MTALLRSLLGAAVLLPLVAIPASSGPVCGPHAAMVERLAKQFQESRKAAGLSQQSELIEVYAGTSDAWTIMVTSPAGLSCIVVAGEAWQPDRNFIAGLDS